jgi:hypothetical protein
MACFLPILINFICLFLGLMLKSELDKWKNDCSGLILISDCNIRQLCWLTVMCTTAFFGLQTCERQKMVIWCALCCIPIHICWVKLQSQWLMSNNWSALTCTPIFLARLECPGLHSKVMWVLSWALHKNGVHFHCMPIFLAYHATTAKNLACT